MFHDGVVYGLVRSQEHSFSSFGGPLEIEVSGRQLGHHRLHKIAKLSFHHIPVLGPPLYVFDVPLIYGMRYSGCAIKYLFESGKIEVKDIDPPNSQDNWPYLDYPSILPFGPLMLGETRKQSWSAFAEEFPNMPQERPAELIAVVEPPMTLGFSLWGDSGDAEGVAIVFECDLKARQVYAYNVCG